MRSFEQSIVKQVTLISSLTLLSIHVLFLVVLTCSCKALSSVSTGEVSRGVDVPDRDDGVGFMDARLDSGVADGRGAGVG